MSGNYTLLQNRSYVVHIASAFAPRWGFSPHLVTPVDLPRYLRADISLVSVLSGDITGRINLPHTVTVAPVTGYRSSHVDDPVVWRNYLFDSYMLSTDSDLTNSGHTWEFDANHSHDDVNGLWAVQDWSIVESMITRAEVRIRIDLSEYHSGTIVNDTLRSIIAQVPWLNPFFYDQVHDANWQFYIYRGFLEWTEVAVTSNSGCRCSLSSLDRTVGWGVNAAYIPAYNSGTLAHVRIWGPLDLYRRLTNDGVAAGCSPIEEHACEEGYTDLPAPDFDAAYTQRAYNYSYTPCT